MNKAALIIVIVLILGVVGVVAVRNRSGAEKPPEEEKSNQPEQTAAQAERKEVKTSSGIEMVFLPGGSFMMGDKDGDDNVKHVHKVEVSSFWIDKYEVSQASFLALMKVNPSKKNGLNNNPVERIAWYAAVKYCNARSKKEGLTPCYDEKTWKCNFDADGYRLPTEAEWEYACRAGTTTLYSFGDKPDDLFDNGWFEANAESKHHERGKMPPNPWGLYDMHGNIWEWCNDFYDPEYYKKSPIKDPRGPETGKKYVLRGGSWLVAEERCTSASRRHDYPTVDDVCSGREDHGFRCVKKAQ